ncbi:NAD-dependent epimerase/dehydratase family protein [Patescibacteria group bacterium]|nr:NAD-dependent epimerase/dehydratase family protein [Patescibacteria group bacterium]
MDKIIGFIGQGWIGKNYADDFERRGFKVVRYAKEPPYNIKNGDNIKDCDIVFIAVPTPTTPQGFDDSILRETIKLVGHKKIVVIKSTILPGTTESIQKENPDIYVLHSPEFLTEVNAVYDAANPNRNIVGIPIDNSEYRQKAQEVLDMFPKAPYHLICDSRDAEMIKYGGNCWSHFKVVFMNLLYDLAKKTGCSFEVVKNAMSFDPRIGRTHLDVIHKGGRGSGGNCFIKDYAVFADLYEKYMGNDELGVKLLRVLEEKNINLLISSNKDLKILAGVYGEEFVESRKEIYQKKKCLVTGGAGFIGSNLVDELISRGYEVVIIDNLSTGKRENLNPKAEFHELDIRDLEKIKPLFEGVDYVFHTAALPRVQPSILDPITSHDVNVNGTLNVLKAAVDAKVKKVIYSASSSAYGNQEIMPLREDMPASPLSPYALHKHLGELYCRLFSKIYGLPTVSLRYFNIYGRRQSLEGAYALVIAIFIRQRINNEPITITGDGEQRRDFTGVKDVVEANILAAESDKVGQGEVINIGRGQNYSVNEIARFIGGPTVNIAARLEPRETLADNSLARDLLGWEPKVNLPEWLEEYRREMGLVDFLPTAADFENRNLMRKE